MKLKRIIGIIVCIGGVALLFLSNYIKNQVEDGKEQIADAEKKVGQGKTLFGQNPYTKVVGDQLIFNSADQKINAGKQDVAHYEALAHQLQIAGIITIIVGAGIIFIPFSRQKR